MIRSCWSRTVRRHRGPSRPVALSRRRIPSDREPASAMMEEDARRWRTVVAGVLLGLGFLIALGRLFHLQVLHAEQLAPFAGRPHQKILTVGGGGGANSHRNGKILAITIEGASV